MLPKAILFDLDDTILSAYNRPLDAWSAVLGEFAHELQLPIIDVARAIEVSGRNFWADATRHAYWRQRLDEARRAVVANAFARLSADGRQAPDQDFAVRLADRFSRYREEQLCFFPGARETIDELKSRGVRLALVTNGAAEPQRAKVERFDLARRFDHVQIEGEHGFGKPEERAYLHAMQALGVLPADTWMVGDNLEWEVAAPQRLGIYAVWHDVLGEGLPPDSTVKPDRIIRALGELLPQGA
jgi:putative hydrolase of the HAD superfamily